MLEITTLGKFSVKINGKSVDEYFRKTKRLLQLLNLFIIARSKPISVNYICDSIWGDEDDFDTQKALQNLIYRFRRVFIENGMPDGIAYTNKMYSLSDSLDISVDVYKLEDNYNRALSNDIDIDEKTKLLQEIIELYNGEYIFNSISDDNMSYNASVRYKRIFIDTACILSDIYSENSSHDEMMQLCNKVIAIEPLEEAIYSRIVEAMLIKGEAGKAISVLEDYFELLYRETGSRASDSINNLYKKLKGSTDSLKNNAEKIFGELQEVNSLEQALFCSFDVFKDIYRYEMRQLDRRIYSISLVILEICSLSKEEMSDKILQKSRKILNECCFKTLRKDDVFSGYSKTQTVLMLIIKHENDAQIVIERLKNKFNNNVKHDNTYLKVITHNTLPLKLQ